MGCHADVKNIACYILESAAIGIEADMYDLECLIDSRADSVCKARVYNWILKQQTACTVSEKLICKIQRFSDALDINLDLCEEKVVESCDSIVDCSTISITEVGAVDCALPKTKTITILK